MTATDELRRLLDERGVEWAEPTMKPNTTWFPDAYGTNCRVKPWGDALCVKRYGLTPQQAIDATLGRGTCRETIIDHYWRGCGSCGYIWEFMYGIGKCERPRYCPNCGRRVEP